MNAKRFIIGLILMVMPIVSMADGKLSKDPLPDKICSFLTTHFPNVKVAFYKIEKNILRIESYDVILTDGTDLEFDGSGNWTEIDGEKKALPLSVIPPQVLKYVNEHFPDQFVVCLDKKKRDRVEVQLNSGWELLFDKNYQIINIED